jgi:hypothetical protein
LGIAISAIPLEEWGFETHDPVMEPISLDTDRGALTVDYIRYLGFETKEIIAGHTLTHHERTHPIHASVEMIEALMQGVELRLTVRTRSVQIQHKNRHGNPIDYQEAERYPLKDLHSLSEQTLALRRLLVRRAEGRSKDRRPEPLVDAAHVLCGR